MTPTPDARRSNLFKKFLTDETAEEQGIWVNFGDGIRFKVRRFKSKASSDARKELDKPFANEIRRETMTPQAYEDLLLKQMAKGVIADWEGVDLGDGAIVAYSPDSAYKLLKALPELRDELFRISVDADAFKAKMDEDAEGNS